MNTKLDVQSVMDASKLIADSSTLISCAVNVMRLNYSEALMFYYIMVKVRISYVYIYIYVCMWNIVNAVLHVSM